MANTAALEQQVSFFDAVLLMSLNEKAYKNGLIDEGVKEKIRQELQQKLAKAADTA